MSYPTKAFQEELEGKIRRLCRTGVVNKKGKIKMVCYTDETMWRVVIESDDLEVWIVEIRRRIIDDYMSYMSTDRKASEIAEQEILELLENPKLKPF